MKKDAKTAVHLLEGALIGAALAVGARMLAGSKFAKELGEDIKDKSVEFYEYLIPQLKKAEKMSEAQYKAFVKEAAKRYGKEKKLSAAQAKHLIEEAQASWSHLKENL